jgi:hypothetical protein
VTKLFLNAPLAASPAWSGLHQDCLDFECLKFAGI